MGEMWEYVRRGLWAVVDGGLATELERHGADLNDPLWSAKCLLTTPHLITKVHLDYLKAGADIIITASYQRLELQASVRATIQGFEAKGFSREEAEALLLKSVQIAIEARNIYYESCSDISCDGTDIGYERNMRNRPVLVAASIGSYGAYLADGSEYSGNYGEAVTLSVLKEFHRRRVQVLAQSGADLIAFETIPNKIEAQAYAEIMKEEDIKIPAWFSFSSKDGVNVANGDSIFDCAEIADSSKNVVAMGINCTAPHFIHGLIQSIKKVTDKPIVVYPNSGETYDATQKKWIKSEGVIDEDFVSYVSKWREAGASLFGGCCRTTPNTIRAISNILAEESVSLTPN
ncbi:hypothetical protein Sjap_006519 [Stephania japonica]|uniref:Hcy-binding domain-containing protein n=1 Tax=Stephania japonica TaxID=461633 RepID=A0AAP0K649_9MAGN